MTADAIVAGVHFLPDDPPDDGCAEGAAGEPVRSRRQGREARGLPADAGAAAGATTPGSPPSRAGSARMQTIRLPAARRRHRVARPDRLRSRSRRSAGSHGRWSAARRPAGDARAGHRHDRRRRARAAVLQGRRGGAMRDNGSADTLLGRYLVPEPRNALAAAVRDHATRRHGCVRWPGRRSRQAMPGVGCVGRNRGGTRCPAVGCGERHLRAAPASSGWRR